MSKVSVSFRVEDSKVRELDLFAKATRRDRTQLIDEALDNYLDAQQWQLQEIKAALKDADAGDFATDAEVNAVFDREVR